MPAIDINTLLSEAKCYACYEPGAIPYLSSLALLNRIISGSSPTPPAGFQPSDIAGLQIWAKADAGAYQDAGLTTPCTDGTSLFTWKNFGNGALVTNFVQAVAGSRPTWRSGGGGNNNAARVTFSTDDFITLLGTVVSPYTVIVQCRYNSFTGVPGGTYAMIVNALIPFAQLYIAGTAGGASPASANTSGVTNTSAANDGGVGNALAIMDEFNTAIFTPTIRVNKGATTGESGGIGNANMIDTTLGGYAGNGYFLNGEISEVMIYSGVLSSTQKDQIWAYLKTKYGMLY